MQCEFPDPPVKWLSKKLATKTHDVVKGLMSKLT